MTEEAMGTDPEQERIRLGETDEDLFAWVLAPGGLARKRMFPPDYLGDRDVEEGEYEVA